MSIKRERVNEITSRIADPKDTDNPHGGWLSDESARRKKGTPSGLAARFNDLPPGMNIENQHVSDQRRGGMNESTSGSQARGKNAGDYSDYATPEALLRGYNNRPMLATDDPSGTDMFYTEVEVDGKTGFLERSNVLDRY